MKELSARGAVIAASAVATFVIGAGTAGACINIHISPSVGTAGPGDAVGFTISGVLAGAQYTVSVDGHAVASGTSTGETIAGSFAMPDLGTQSFLTEITAMIAHDDLEQSPWPTSSALEYQAPEAAPSHETTPVAAAPVAVTASTPRPAKRERTPAARSAPTVPLQTPPAYAPPVSAPAVHARPRTRTTHLAPRMVVPRNLDRPASVPRVVVVDVRPPAHTAWPLAALLLFLAAVPLAVAYMSRGRHRPPPPPDEVEIELQEIIAEELAQRSAGAPRRTLRSG